MFKLRYLPAYLGLLCLILAGIAVYQYETITEMRKSEIPFAGEEDYKKDDKYIQVYQEVEPGSYSKGTTFLTTQVWVLDGNQRPSTLELWHLDSVTDEELQEMKGRRYVQADSVANELIKILGKQYQTKIIYKDVYSDR